MLASSFRIPRRDALASLSRVTGAFNRSSMDSWRRESMKIFLDSAVPDHLSPFRTRSGSAATIWRSGPSAESLVSTIKSTSHSAVVPTSPPSRLGTITCLTSRPLRSVTRTHVVRAPKEIPTMCPAVPGTSRYVERRPRRTTASTPCSTTKPSKRSSSTFRDTVAWLKRVNSISLLRVKGASERTASKDRSLTVVTCRGIAIHSTTLNEF